MSAGNRLPALVAFGRLHTRAGLAEGRDALDEAMALTSSIDTSETLGLVRAARAEAAWLAGNPAQALDEARAGFASAIRERNPWVAGELAYWQWKAGAAVPAHDWWAAPFAAQMAGDWVRAAAAWRALGCPYEEARALAEGDVRARREALEVFTRLGAERAARNLARTMRASGVGHLPRGPYAATRADPFGLTPRQADVLHLLSEGLSNPEIAERLALTPKTVDHHVTAVLAKLDVHSRKAAAAVARRSASRVPGLH
jgi:DNA-binding CsgD family transcriptional regulator